MDLLLTFEEITKICLNYSLQLLTLTLAVKILSDKGNYESIHHKFGELSQPITPVFSEAIREMGPSFCVQNLFVFPW